MKKLSMILILIFCISSLFGQTFKSPYTIEKTAKFTTNYKERTIVISDKEIAISNFIGGTKTQVLIVNKIEEKDWDIEGKCKFYYCTTKDADPINGYQKAIIIKGHSDIWLGLFADEITIYVYQFSIN